MGLLQRTIDIRPLEKDELHRLHNFPFSKMETHRRRFGLQQTGKLIFLIAWWRDLPVGQALLNWQGGDASAVPPQIRAHPEVASLFVTPFYRRSGIATQLLDTVERIAFAHEYDHIGLCLWVDNHHARTLYEQRGYQLKDAKPYIARGSYIDKRGLRRNWEEHRIYMVKNLTAQDTL